MSLPIHEIINRIGPAQERSKDWQHSPEIVELHSDLFDYVASLEYPYLESQFSNKGIVICGGGKYAHLAWIAISTLRHFGCSLPIELWYKGNIELNSTQIKEFEKIGSVVCKNTNSVSPTPRRLNGWEMKPFSMIHSSFEEVLLLDADCIVAGDPTYLFSTEPYLETGATFWPDLPNGKVWIPEDSWNAARIASNNRENPAFETGQILVNKRKCWKAMMLTMHLNEYSDFWYEYVYGDKDTFKLAWHKIEQKYSMPNKSAWRSPAIIQHDFNNKPIFYHCCQGKKFLKEGRKIGALPTEIRSEVIHFSRAYPKNAGLEGTLKDRSAFENHCKSRALGVKMSDNKVLTRIYSDVILFCDDRSHAFTPHLMRDGFWEAWISLFLLRNVQTDWSVLNIGAHVGYYTYLLAPSVRRVVAVEPNLRNVELMKLSNQENEYSHINIIHGALSNQESVDYFVPNNGNDVCGNIDGVGALSGTVPGYSLDQLIDLMDEVPDLIICDCEGAERYLNRVPKRALIEVEHGRSYPQDYFLRGKDLLYVDYDSMTKYTRLEHIEKDTTRSYMVWVDTVNNKPSLPQEVKEWLAQSH